VFEIEGPADRAIVLECDGERLEFTLAEAMRESGLVIFYDKVKALVRDTFGLGEADFENPADAYYHNAYIREPGGRVLPQRVQDQAPPRDPRCGFRGDARMDRCDPGGRPQLVLPAGLDNE